MKQIDDSILTRLAFGCIRAVKSKTGWQFFRFTEKQTELFSAYNPYYPEPFFDGYFLRNCYTMKNGPCTEPINSPSSS